MPPCAWIPTLGRWKPLPSMNVSALCALIPTMHCRQNSSGGWFSWRYTWRIDLLPRRYAGEFLRHWWERPAFSWRAERVFTRLGLDLLALWRTRDEPLGFTTREEANP